MKRAKSGANGYGPNLLMMGKRELVYGYVYMYLYMYVYMYVYMYACWCVWVDGCVHVCMSICILYGIFCLKFY